MDNLHINTDAGVRAVTCREIEQEIIPETFPTWAGFFRTVGLGVAITATQFALLIILMVKSSR